MTTTHKMKTIVATSLAVTIGCASVAVYAQSAPKPEALIKSRQSAFQYVAWNFGRIKASLDGPYNKDDVTKAANAIAAIASSNLPNLFAANTEQGKGWHDTATKAELFKDSKRVNELFADFAKESTELAKVALHGDSTAVKEQYGKLGKACKTCHDDFRVKD